MTTSGIGQGIAQNYRADTAAIASSGTKTPAIDCKGLTLYALEMPATFTGASVSFEATLSDADDATFVPVTDDAGNTYTAIVSASKVVLLDVQKMAGLRRLKIVSASTEAAEREIRCGFRVV